jgi:hypothetical protein
MDKEFKNLIKEAKKIQLKLEDKTRVRERLYHFMEQNPLPQTVPMTALFRKYAVAFTALIIILGVSGVSVAAEGTTPGNMLYPIKQMNEKIASSLIFSEKAKLRWEMRKVERRLEEAEKLAAKESLEAKRVAYLEEDFEKRARKINEKIAEYELKNKMAEAAEFSSNFETSLRAHDQILTKIIKSKSAPESKIEPLVLNVRAKTNLASRVRIKTEDAVLTAAPMSGEDPQMLGSQDLEEPEGSLLDLAVKERLAHAEERIENVQKLLQEQDLSEETKTTAQERLDWAKELIEQGRTHLENGVISKSFLLAQQANRIAQEIEILIESHLDLFDDIDKQGTISIKDCNYPILESFPRQCATPDGNLVIEEDLEIEIPR